MPITAAQCRAARALLAWSQDDLVDACAAREAKLSKATIANFELEKRSPYRSTLDDLQATFEAAGIVFLGSGESADGGSGVRFAGIG